MSTNTRMPEGRSRIDLQDVLVVVGLAMLAGGLAAFDWRLALVVCGAVLLAVGLTGAMRG